MFNKQTPFQLSIDDELRIHQLLDQQCAHVDQGLFKIRKHDQWIAIPEESADHFTPTTITRIVEALRHNGDTQVYALLWEQLMHVPTALSFPSTIDGINHLNQVCGSFSYILCSDKMNWIILCTKSDYYLMCGEVHLVQTMIGCDMKTGISAFKEFIHQMEPLPSIQSQLQHIINQCEYDYVRAKEGDWVMF